MNDSISTKTKIEFLKKIGADKVRHGEGTLTYSDGRVYVGEFVDGLEHGQGTGFKKEEQKLLM